MARWIRGEAQIEQQLRSGELQAVRGAQADGTPWLAKAARTVATAASLVDADPSSAITLAYDAARFAAMAVLAQQGLRATTKGGHLAVDEAVRAQFGDALRPFRALRVRRNELEYPDHPDEIVESEEATDAVSGSRGIIDACAKLLPHLGFFHT
jgi:hypothetical protein